MESFVTSDGSSDDNLSLYTSDDTFSSIADSNLFSATSKTYQTNGGVQLVAKAEYNRQLARDQKRFSEGGELDTKESHSSVDSPELLMDGIKGGENEEAEESSDKSGKNTPSPVVEEHSTSKNTVESHEKAVTSLFDESDSDAYYKSGVEAYAMGNTKEARSYFELSLVVDMAQCQILSRGSAQTHKMIGTLYMQTGELEKGRRHLDMALEIYSVIAQKEKNDGGENQKDLIKDKISVADIQNAKGRLLHDMLEFGQAKEVLYGSREILQSLTKMQESGEFPEDLNDSLSLIVAVNHKSLGLVSLKSDPPDLAAAKKECETGLGIFKILNLTPKQRVDMAEAHNCLVSVYKEEGNLSEAVSNYFEELKIYADIADQNASLATTDIPQSDKGKDSTNLLRDFDKEALLRQARMYLDHGNHDVVEAILELQNKKWPLDLMLLVRHSNMRGLVCWDRGDLKGAKEQYKQAIKFSKRLEKELEKEKELAKENELQEVYLERAEAHRGLGDVFRKEAMYKSSEDNFLLALGFAKKCKTRGTKLARIHSNLGNFYRKERRYDEAREQLDKVDEIFKEKKFEGNKEKETVENNSSTEPSGYSSNKNDVRFPYAPPGEVRILADAHQFKGSIHQEQGDFRKAMEEYKEAYFYSASSRGTTHSLSAGNVYRHFGEVFLECGQLEWARLYFEASIRGIETNLGGKHGTVGIMNDYLGTVKQRENLLDEALAHYEKSLEIKTLSFGSEHPVIAITLNNEGIVCWKKGLNDDAIVKFMVSQKIFKKSLAGEDRKAWDMPLPNFSNTKRGLGDQRFLYEECFGEDRQAVAYLYNNIGNELQHRKMYDEALRFYEKSIEIKSETIGEEHRSVATTSANIANLYQVLPPENFKVSQQKHDQQRQALLDKWERKNPLSVFDDFMTFLLDVSADQSHHETEIKEKLLEG